MEKYIASFRNVAETMKICINYASSEYAFDEGYIDVNIIDDNTAYLAGSFDGEDWDDEYGEPLNSIIVAIVMTNQEDGTQISIKTDITGDENLEFLDSVVYEVYKSFGITDKDVIDIDKYVNELKAGKIVDLFISLEERCLALIPYYGVSVLREIKNPSESLLIAALKEDIAALQFIDNPSPSLLAKAFKDRYINRGRLKTLKISEETIKNLIGLDGEIIEVIDNPSEELQIIAVKQTPHALQYIKNPSEAVIKAMLESFDWAIEVIENPSESIQLLSVRSNPTSIRYIKEPTEAVKMEAIKLDYTTLAFIKHPTEEMKELAKTIRKSAK